MVQPCRSTIRRRRAPLAGTASFFIAKQKIRNNLYGFVAGHRRYLDYLIRRNGINSADVSQRIIYIRYHNLLSRSEAAASGTYYGPETRYDLHRW